MTIGEIHQVIIGFVSLCVTTFVAVVIYKLQRKQERLVSEAKEQLRLKDLSEKAKNFIIDNQEEIAYLPLCVMAASLNPYVSHCRKIYNKFNKCSKELQTEILTQEYIYIKNVIDSTVLNTYLDKIIELESQYKLGKSILYDGKKYFWRSFERYKEKIIENADPYIFEKKIDSSISKFLGKDCSIIKIGLTQYINDYLENKCKTSECGAYNQQKEPPMDMIWRMFELANCEESEVCFWTMRYVISMCYAFDNPNLINSDDLQEEMTWIDDYIIETYEDMFYTCALALFIGFSRSK